MLVEVTRLHDKLVDWARGGVAMARINSDRCMALEKAVEATIELVQPAGLDLHE